MDDKILGEKPKGLKDPKEYSFKEINDPLKKIYCSIISSLKKEPQDPPTLFIIKTILETCFQTYRVIVKLVSELEQEKYPIQAHMLSRSIIDALFVVMALLDRSDNTNKYELAGFRGIWAKYEQEKIAYKDLPDAQAYLNEQDKLITHMTEKLFKLTPEEKSDPSKIKYWPIPGQMIKENSPIELTLERKEFLKGVYKWHYNQPSELEHFSWQAIAMKIFTDHPEDHWSPGKYESDAVYTAQLFLLMMLSEVEAFKKYGSSQDLKNLWILLGKYYLEVNEYYQIRYSKILS